MMLQNVGNILKIGDLKKKILYTFAILIVYRIGTHVPLPGVNGRALLEYFNQMRGTVFGLYDMFVGGALSRAAVFGVGIMPYISASIILQLLTTTVPALERLHKEGEHGRRKIEQYTRYLTVLVAAIQASGVAVFLSRLTSPSGAPVVPNPGLGFFFTTIISLVAGTVFLMWLGEEISQRGIGNGISVIIFAGTLDSVPNEVMQTIRLVQSGTITPLTLILVIAVILGATAAVVAVTEAQRRIPIHYARRVVGRKIYGGQTTYLPLTVNTAGVIPIIFAQALLTFPNTITTFVSAPWVETFNQVFRPGNIVYDLIYGGLIIFFAYFYTSIVMNPRDLADNLQRYSGFIPGIRPGQQTAEYIDRILSRIILPGAVFFALIAILPFYLMRWAHVPFYFGGTRLLIIVGVALELMQQVEAHLVMRQYEGLLKRGRIRGWRG
ncbi:MAG: preprotein translocase subunit SecY [Candidatus Hydrothermota bacterium]|nr:MAG: preprotein translocase subunit SecY [Candidatus Hydrothermae bacterium]